VQPVKVGDEQRRREQEEQHYEGLSEYTNPLSHLGRVRGRVTHSGTR
jgi:hypothetical protein